MAESQPPICSRLEGLRTELFGARGKSRMARELGIRPSTYDRYERDRVPPAELLVKIANVCNVTLDWLLTGDGPRRPPQVLDRESADLSRRFEEAIAFDQSLRPVAAAFLAWLEDRRSRPDQTPARFELPASDSTASEVIFDTSYDDDPDDRGDPDGSDDPPPGPVGGPNGGSDGGSGGGADGGPGQEPGGSTGGAGGSGSGGTNRPPAGSPPAGTSSSGTSSRGPSTYAMRGLGSTMIPVVGRSSAGVLSFWKDLPITPGPELDAHVQTIIDRTQTPPEFDARSGESESSQVEASGSVQIVSLATATAGSLQFVRSAELKARFPRAVAWQLDGDSMEPRFFHGDVVVVSIDQEAIEGQPCVVRIRGQVGVTCKVFHREGDDVMLLPINPRVEVQRVPAADIEYAARVLFVVRA